MKIDLSNPVPLYQQIIDGIKLERLTGRWRSGDRIPPVREMALLLRINPNTVAKAYRLLQEEGVLESRPGGGTFLSGQKADSLEQEREKRLEEKLRQLLSATDTLGVPRQTVIGKLQQIIEEDQHE